MSPLGDMRGKLILVFDYSDYIAPSTGRFRYMDGSSASPNANLTVYDSYSETADYDAMKAGQLNEWQHHRLGEKNYAFLLSWTLTSSNPPISPSIESLANKANSHIASVLNAQIVGKKWNGPNFVYMDFLTSNITKSIIAYNLNGSLQPSQ